MEKIKSFFNSAVNYYFENEMDYFNFDCRNLSKVLQSFNCQFVKKTFWQKFIY